MHQPNAKGRAPRRQVVKAAAAAALAARPLGKAQRKAAALGAGGRGREGEE
jgi:hypothetical protein